MLHSSLYELAGSKLRMRGAPAVFVPDRRIGRPRSKYVWHEHLRAFRRSASPKEKCPRATRQIGRSKRGGCRQKNGAATGEKKNARPAENRSPSPLEGSQL